MPTGARAGTAYIEFRGDFSALERQLATHMRGLSREIDINADTSGLRGFNRELSKTHKEASRTDRDFVSLGRTVSRTNANFSLLRNSVQLIKWPALITGAGAAAQGLSALGAGAVGLTSALAPLSGALVALPAMFGAMAQGAGTAALAFTGLGDALGAMSDAQSGAGEAAQQSGEQQRAAAETVRSAELSLATAQRSVKFAQEDLTLAREDAVRQLEDMRLAAEGAATSEKEALLALHEARRALREVRDDPDSGLFDRRNALLAVEAAEQALAQARLDSKRSQDELNDAEREGVDGAEQVVSARRALSDAQRQAAEANHDLATAQRSATEAMSETGTAADNLQQKMAALPPSLQEFAKFLFALKPRMDALRETAAQGLFPGLQRGIEAALGSFPSLERVIGQTASAMGHLAHRTGQFLGREGFGRDFERIGAGNVRLMEHMGSASLHLADALRHVVVAGAPLVDWMGRSINRFSSLIEQEAKAGRESGRLAEFFGQTREVMERLTSIGGSLAAVFQEIGQAAAPLGRDILKSLDQGAENLERWAESTTGRNSLREYFDDAKPAIYETGRLIRDASESFFRMGNTPGLANLIRQFRLELLPVLETLVTTTTAAFGPKLIDLLVEFGKTLGTFIGATGPLTKFVEFLTAGLRVFNSLLDTSPALKGMVVSFASMAAIFKTMKFAGAITGVTTLIGLFGKLKTAGAAAGAVGGAQGIVAGSSMFGGQVATTVGQQGSKLGTRLGTSIGSAAGPIITAMIGSAIAGAWVGSKLNIGQSKIGDRIAEELDVGLKKAMEVEKWMRAHPGLSADQAFDDMRRSAKQMSRSISDDIDHLSYSWGLNLNEIRQNSDQRMKQIEQTLGLHSKRGRQLVEENFTAVAQAIKNSMKSGEISADRGMKALDKLLRKQLRSYGITDVAGFIATTEGKASRDRPGTSSPGGKQRGGLIMQGAPTGDSVPAMLERDEYVLNRKATAFIGKGVLDRINFGLAKRFAGGGIVGLGKRLQREGYEVGEHPAFGGVDPDAHTATSYHYRGMALDVSDDIPPFASGSGEPGSLDRLYQRLKGMSGVVELLWRVANHFDHLHVAMSGSGSIPGAGPSSAKIKLPRWTSDFPLGVSVAEGLNINARAAEKTFTERLASRLGAHPATGFGGISGGGSPAANKKLGRQMMMRLWGATQWPALRELWTRESGWSHTATNPTSGAYGIPQSLPASKMASAGADWRTNPATQIKWGLGYIGERYGTPSSALSFHDANNWYAKGGLVQMLKGGGGAGKGGKDRGPTVSIGTAKGVLPPKLLKALRALRGLTPTLEEQIANATTFAGFATSPEGADLSAGERRGLIGLNTGLLANLTSLAAKLAQGIGLLPGGNKQRGRLVEELVGLQGITGEGGTILGVRQVLDELGAPSDFGTEPSVLDSMRADLLAQLLAEERARSAVLTAQVPTFQQLFKKAPWGGVFHDGGTVPGYRGQPRTILAEGGEVVGHPGPVEVTLIVNDGAINPDAIEVRINDRLAKIARGSSPRGGVIGRKAAYVAR